MEGRNLAIEDRWAEGSEDRLAVFAAELVQVKVDVVVTQGTVATLAVHRTTTTIPNVFAVAGDPLGARVVASLAHPGGNVTGFAVMGSDLTGIDPRGGPREPEEPLVAARAARD